MDGGSVGSRYTLLEELPIHDSEWIERRSVSPLAELLEETPPATECGELDACDKENTTEFNIPVRKSEKAEPKKERIAKKFSVYPVQLLRKQTGKKVPALTLGKHGISKGSRRRSRGSYKQATKAYTPVSDKGQCVVLPPEMLKIIFEKLDDAKDVLSVGMVSKGWRAAVLDSSDCCLIRAVFFACHFKLTLVKCDLEYVSELSETDDLITQVFKKKKGEFGKPLGLELERLSKFALEEEDGSRVYAAISYFAEIGCIRLAERTYDDFAEKTSIENQREFSMQKKAMRDIIEGAIAFEVNEVLVRQIPKLSGTEAVVMIEKLTSFESEKKIALVLQKIKKTAIEDTKCVHEMVPKFEGSSKKLAEVLLDSIRELAKKNKPDEIKALLGIVIKDPNFHELSVVNELYEMCIICIESEATKTEGYVLLGLIKAVLEQQDYYFENEKVYNSWLQLLELDVLVGDYSGARDCIKIAEEVDVHNQFFPKPSVCYVMALAKNCHLILADSFCTKEKDPELKTAQWVALAEGYMSSKPKLAKKILKQEAIPTWNNLTILGSPLDHMDVYSRILKDLFWLDDSVSAVKYSEEGMYKIETTQENANSKLKIYRLLARGVRKGGGASQSLVHMNFAIANERARKNPNFLEIVVTLLEWDQFLRAVEIQEELEELILTKSPTAQVPLIEQRKFIELALAVSQLREKGN